MLCAKIRSFLLFAMVFMILPFAQASQDLTTTSAQDETFRQLRDASRKQDVARASRLADSLRTYPVPSYVDYYLLKSNLRNASETEVDAYLNKYKG